MSHYLPPQVMAFFAPRPPAPFVPPVELPKPNEYSGVGSFIERLSEAPAPCEPKPTREQKADLIRALKEEENVVVITEAREKYNPRDPAATAHWTSSADRTIFVGRLDYSLSEDALRTEFSHFGEVSCVCMPTSKTGLPAGYAFVEFASLESIPLALREADGQLLGGRRIVVDRERSRRDHQWLPRRLGGGLGARAGKGAGENGYAPHSSREIAGDGGRDGLRAGARRPAGVGGHRGGDRDGGGLRGRTSDWSRRDRDDRDHGSRSGAAGGGNSGGWDAKDRSKSRGPRGGGPSGGSWSKNGGKGRGDNR